MLEGLDFSSLMSHDQLYEFDRPLSCVIVLRTIIKLLVNELYGFSITSFGCSIAGTKSRALYKFWMNHSE